jgi:hypothetical protein
VVRFIGVLVEFVVTNYWYSRILNLLVFAFYTKNDAYTSSGNESSLYKEDWVKIREAESPQLYFWHLAMRMELNIFLRIRSFR